jgi:hypothetical protein
MGATFRNAETSHHENPMMSKLKLLLDDLRVDTFDTTAVRMEKGTVFGEQCTCATACTCPGYDTCGASCNGTCGGFSCNASNCGDFPSCVGGTRCTTDELTTIHNN